MDTNKEMSFGSTCGDLVERQQFALLFRDYKRAGILSSKCQRLNYRSYLSKRRQRLLPLPHPRCPRLFLPDGSRVKPVHYPDGWL